MADGTATFKLHFPTGNGSDGRRVDAVFGAMNALKQSLRGVFIQHGDSFLSDDGARVNSLINKMDSGAGVFDAVIQCLLPGFQAWK